MKNFSDSWTFHQSRSDLFRSTKPDWHTCFHLYKLLWFLMLIWQFLLNPLISKHGFVKLNVIRTVSAVWKSFACFPSSPDFGCLADGSRFTVCPSHWVQTAELKCEGWNHTSKSNVPAEKLSEHNIWVDEVIKRVFEYSRCWIMKEKIHRYRTFSIPSRSLKNMTDDEFRHVQGKAG